MDMAGRAVLITGGAGGLGSAMARRLRAAGAGVVIHDRDTARGASVAAALNAAGSGPLVRFVAGDLGDLPAVRDQALFAKHGITMASRADIERRARRWSSAARRAA